MNEPVIYQEKLPTTIEDLSRFVLVGREKLTAVRAEIRAIDKIQLATEVRDQKRDEARMLSEALLDAEVKLGEMIKEIPKATKGNQYTGKMVSDSGVGNQRPKHEVIAELGFSQKQAERFETLADNKDLVEQAKAEARENDDIPTRTQVLSLAKARNDRYERDMNQIDEDYSNLKRFWKPFKEIDRLSTDCDFMDSVLRAVIPDREEREWHRKEFGEEDESLKDEIDRVNAAISKLIEVRDYFLTADRKGGQYGKV